MIRILLLFGALLMTTSGAAADCRTPLGIPCYTIHYKSEQKSLFRLDFGAFATSSTDNTFARRSDGSSYHGIRRVHSDLTHGQLPAYRTNTIYDAKANRVLVILPDQEEFNMRAPRYWHDRPYRRSNEGDATCATGILHQGTDFQQSGTESILGRKAVLWRRELQYGGSEELWLAPELDCIALKMRRVSRNWLRLPEMVESMEATSVELTEPPAHFFNVPAGYREVQSRFVLRGSR